MFNSKLIQLHVQLVLIYSVSVSWFCPTTSTACCSSFSLYVHYRHCLNCQQVKCVICSSFVSAGCSVVLLHELSTSDASCSCFFVCECEVIVFTAAPVALMQCIVTVGCGGVLYEPKHYSQQTQARSRSFLCTSDQVRSVHCVYPVLFVHHPQ